MAYEADIRSSRRPWESSVSAVAHIGNHSARMLRALHLVSALVGCVALNAVVTSIAVAQSQPSAAQKAYNGGVMLGTVQWAVAVCGGEENPVFVTAMQHLGSASAPRFREGRLGAQQKMRDIERKDGRDHACTVAAVMFGPKGENGPDAWVMPKGNQ